MSDELTKDELETWRHAESGIAPLPGKVLLRMDEVPDKIGSIYVPVGTKAQQDAASETGVILAVNPETAYPFVVGERIAITRYAGRDIKGKDGVAYRVVDEKDFHAYTIKEGDLK